MPDTIEILHNAGVFGFNHLFWGLFLVSLALLLIGNISFFLFLIQRWLFLGWNKRAAFKAILFGVIFLAFDIFYSPSLLAKVIFARAYKMALALEADKAEKHYLIAAKLDPNLSSAINGLCEAYNRSYEPAKIRGIKHLVDKSSDVHLVAKYSNLLDRSGFYEEAAEMYDKAFQISKDPIYLLKKCRSLIASQEWESAFKQIEHLEKRVLDSYASAELFYLKAVVDGKKNKAEVLKNFENALHLAPQRAEYYLGYANALFKIGYTREAIEQLHRAVNIRDDLSTAHHQLGTYYYLAGNLELAARFLKKAIYYDNKNTKAGILHAAANGGRVISPEELNEVHQGSTQLTPNISPLHANIGDRVQINITFQPIELSNDVSFFLFEPYGFGLEGEVKSSRTIKMLGAATQFELEVIVHCKRPSSVNLGKPWELNIVCFEQSTGRYFSHIVKVLVVEGPTDEGRVLLVITEDLEQTSGFGKMKETSLPQITARDARIDLIEKPRLARQIAGRYGIKWSHIVDIGSTVLRPRWAQEVQFGSAWNQIWPHVHEGLLDTFISGGDVQLHIHGYNVPGNQFSRQYFDFASKAIRFEGNMTRMQDFNGRHFAWANNFHSFGTWTNQNSRLGSIFNGIKLLEGELHVRKPDYRTIFFRAGEYEFGDNEYSVAASIQALRMNQILASSDAHEGNPFRRDFKFFQPVGKNVYFSSTKNISDRATSLHDVGILQILPVPERNGHDHLSPTSEFSSLLYNYQLCHKSGKVKPGIFVLMEMFHLNTANIRQCWDSLDPNYGDWKRMSEQFACIKDMCPNLEFVTISDAVKIYLDTYTPDLVALRSNEQCLSETTYEYDINFLGKDINVSTERPHFVVVKPPSYFLGSIDRLEIWHKQNIVGVWHNINDYSDIQFTATARSGYTMRVLLSR